MAGGWRRPTRTGGAQLWNWPDPTSATWILPHGKGGVYALAFSPDGKWLATGSDDKSVRMWNLLDADPSNNPKPLKSGRGWGIQLAFSPDSQWLAGWGHWGRSGSCGAMEPCGSRQPVPPQRCSMDGGIGLQPRRAVAGDARASDLDARGQYGTRLVWDLTKPDPSSDPVRLPGHDYLSDLAFSPDGTWLATGSTDFTAQLWNVSDSLAPPVVLRGHEGPILRVAFSHDGRHVATASKDQTVRLWTASSPTAEPLELRTLDGSARLSLWDLSGAELPSAPRTLDNEQMSLKRALFSARTASGLRLLREQTITVSFTCFPQQAMRTMLCMIVEESLLQPIFSPDGHWLITAGVWDPTIKLWDLKASDPTSAPRLLRGHTTPVRSLAISADGHRLVAGEQKADQGIAPSSFGI